MKRLWFALLLSFSLQALDYQVRFEGVNEKQASLLREISQTLQLETTPPPTLIALKRRAEADIPILLSGLQSLGLYSASITALVDDSGSSALVIFRIKAGGVYPLGEIEVELEGENQENPIEGVTPRDLGLLVGSPAIPEEILKAEDILLQILKKRGYLFAIIEKKVIAREATQDISLLFHVRSGPLIRFGETSIFGLVSVNRDYVESKIAWKVGDPYDPKLLTETQMALESTGLFTTISFEHEKEPSLEGELPFDIILQEGYHRTIGIGAAYNTSLGPGVSLNWDHRNAFCRGHKLAAKADLFWIRQNGKIEYTIPEFLQQNQRLRFVTELEKEHTEGFTETFYSAFIHLDRFPSDCWRYSIGVGYKQLFSSRSNNNEPFALFKLPLSTKLTYIDDPLDPTTGSMLLMKAVPTYRFNRNEFFYTILEGIGSIYQPLSWPLPQVLAFKFNIGSIVGPGTVTIPPPERFYAGSDCTLRGYKYLTVSPLNRDGKPIGGRSLAIFSAEHRVRITSEIGFVTFYDVGNVYDNSLPRLDQKQLQSLGVGLRYYTPVGPLRADIAFPLNKRPIDNNFQIYLSIGQSF